MSGFDEFEEFGKFEEKCSRLQQILNIRVLGATAWPKTMATGEGGFLP